MKIRIRGNSVRFRLTKDEVEILCRTNYIEEITNFPSIDFSYAVVVSDVKVLAIDFTNNKIFLHVPEKLIEGWYFNNKVDFSHTAPTNNNRTIDILLEKDFTCLEDRGEDESNNYPNPKSLAH
ncbi:DUF7009 family protein [Gillisia sp. Hel_I_29]|uniref:DUF7009 family protein n=1 Tax=Gillisia sp. Hel_I_29 TaxID=1249975 RepID=UPI00054E11CD|nr:hypothetical protein [Gillisia sp. Hel_I_29]